MSTVFVLLIGVTAANLALAFFVLWSKPKTEVNRVFALTALSVAGWTLTNAVFGWTSSLATATQAAAFSYLFAVVLGASFLHFSWIFPLRSFGAWRGARQAQLVLWLIAAGVGLLGFVPGLIIQSVNFSGNRAISTGNGIYAIAIFMFSTVAGAGFFAVLRSF